MASVDALFDLAADWLDAAVAAIDQTPSGTPARAYVAPGQPAIDCEQLVVWNQTLAEFPLQAGNGALSRAHAINRGGQAGTTIVIQIVRCVPQGRTTSSPYTPPSAAELQESALEIDRDGWALWLGINYALKHGSLHEDCSGAERLGGEKLVPQGAFGGWTFTYRVPLDGGVLET